MKKNIRIALTFVFTLTILFSALPANTAKALGGKYYLEVDVTHQQVRVYENFSDGSQVLIRKMICSTGKPSTPTRTGTFLLGQKSRVRFSNFRSFPNDYAQYWTHLTSNTYFHSILYSSYNTRDVKQHSINNLGRAVSHGCIRLWPDDAKWIYDNCQTNTYCKVGSFPSSRANATVNPKVQSISLPDRSLKMQVGQTYKPTPTITPNDARREYTWSSSNTSVARVDQNGKITARKAGSANITVYAPHGDKSFTMKLKVQTGPVVATSLKFENKKQSVVMGSTLRVKPTATPATANEKYTYSSSNKAIAKVNSSGKVTPVKPGTCRIYAKSSKGYSAYYTLTVKPKLPTSVTITGGDLTLPKSVQYQLKWKVKPSDATIKDVTFKSSNKAVAKVNSKGVVTTLKNGKTWITVTTKSGKKTNKVLLTVKKVTPEKLTFRAKTATVDSGKTYNLKPTFTPKYVSNTKIKYTSSNSAVATVDKNGIVTTHKPGKATITGVSSSGSRKATCKITVLSVAVKSVSIKQATGSLAIGQTMQLQTTISPSNATDKSLVWASSKTSVAAVNKQGVVTAVAEGTADITVTSANGKKATCRITVQPVVVDSVSITPPTGATGTLAINEQLQLQATVAPSNATNQSLTWASSDSGVVSVDQDGLVTAVAAGTANITATSSNGKTATYEITVQPMEVESVSIALPDGSTTATLTALNEQLQLQATITPSDATDQSLTWTSSNSAIVSVDQDGLATALADGTAEITATSVNMKTSNTITIQVSIAPVP